MKNLAILILIFFTACTTAGLPVNPERGSVSEQAVTAVDRVSAAAQWYCGEEALSFRAVARTIITAVSYLVRPAGLVIPDACAEYNQRRQEIQEQIEAEQAVLESGLLDQQTIPEDIQQ